MAFNGEWQGSSFEDRVLARGRSWVSLYSRGDGSGHVGADRGSERSSGGQEGNAGDPESQASSGWPAEEIFEVTEWVRYRAGASTMVNADIVKSHCLISLSLIGLITVAGCSSFGTITEQRQRVSSGQIGCPPPSIQIENTGRCTWVAVCNGKTFYCTACPSAACKEQMNQ